MLAPTGVGLFALADVGRAYSGGETSSTWHNGVGGGLWFAPLKRSSTVQVSLVGSEQRTALYIGLGFAF